MQKNNIFLWSLYDFANSIVFIVFFLYFSQWLVIDKGVSDFWYNMIFVGSTLLLVVTAPIYGSIGDRTGAQHTYLQTVTVITFICFLAASLAALFWGSPLFAAILFMLANYFYQFSFVFYNALLDLIAPPEKRGLISGIGQASNWLGQIAGLLITLPLAGGAIYLFGEPGRAQTFLPAALLFFALALPMLLFFKRERSADAAAGTPNFSDEYRSQWRQFQELVKVPGMGYFLLGYFFFNDAILTVSNNMPIYLEQVFKVPDATKTMLIAGVLGTSVVGALFSGWLSDKIGLRKSLVIVLGAWIVILPGLAAVTSFAVFSILAIIVGFLFGSIWTVTRAVMLSLCPKDKLGYGFSFYALSERFATFAGPLAWGGITTLFISLGVQRYRIALVAMAAFVAVGLWIVRKIPRQGRFA